MLFFLQWDFTVTFFKAVSSIKINSKIVQIKSNVPNSSIKVIGKNKHASPKDISKKKDKNSYVYNCAIKKSQKIIKSQ